MTLCLIEETVTWIKEQEWNVGDALYIPGLDDPVPVTQEIADGRIGDMFQFRVPIKDVRFAVV